MFSTFCFVIIVKWISVQCQVLFKNTNWRNHQVWFEFFMKCSKNDEKISFENYENFWWKNMNPEWMDHDGSYCHHGNVLKHSKTSFLFPTHTVCHIRYINYTVLLIQSYSLKVRPVIIFPSIGCIRSWIPIFLAWAHHSNFRYSSVR